jgi:ABC-type polysaccharide/polyol phosphate export permease
MEKKSNPKQEFYDSEKRGHPAIEEIKILLKYNDLIVQLVRRDLVSRYKRSVLGIAWTMLNPLGTMLVMTVVFSRVFGRVESYPAYVLSGLAIWNFFSQTTRHCMNSTLWGSGLFGKIFLPRTAFIISSIGTGVVNMTISMVPLFIIMLITHVNIRMTAIYFPLVVLLVATFSLGVGLLLSTYSVYFPDISEMYSIVLTAWMYLSPVIVPEDVLAKIANRWVLKINPLYYFIKIFRSILYDGQDLSPRLVIAAIAISIGIFILGWVVFTKESEKFSYHL